MTKTIQRLLQHSQARLPCARISALAGEVPVRSGSVRTALGPAKAEGEG